MGRSPLPGIMVRSPWEQAEFFPAKPSMKNAYSSLNFFEDHLREGEAARAVLLGRDTTLILTDHRLLELRPHLDDFGFWNVKSFEGYEEVLDLPLAETTLEAREEVGGVVRLRLSCPEGPRVTTLAPHDALSGDQINRFLQLLSGALLRKDR